MIPSYWVKKYLCSVSRPQWNVTIPDAQYTKEDNALKAKLRRLCEPKKGGKLQVPQWLHDQWRTGDHGVMAREFQSCGFDKAHVSLILQSKHHPLIEQRLPIPSSHCFPEPHLSLQDRFIKYKQRTVTKTDTKISDMETGWYTKDDMAKVLKWNATLSCNLLGQNKEIIFAWLSNFKFYSVIYGLFNPWLLIYLLPAEEENCWCYQVL